ncbi:M23 family metallopeptidase [Acidihalobacter prosperus]|nr:peptidoglycan DD-metalloendopeptidase family protein [Acidihalobacter prosperus]
MSTKDDDTRDLRPTNHLRMAGDHNEKAPAAARRLLTLQLPHPAVAPPAASAQPVPSTTEQTSTTIQHKVETGDTLSAILASVGAAEALGKLLQADRHIGRLNQISPGQMVEIAIADGELQRLDMSNGTGSLTRYVRADSGYRASVIERHYEHRKAQAHGVIKDSLFIDAQKAGLSDAQIMALADIFAWDIDFAQDIRPGDHFTVIYDTLYDQGEKIGDGPILAAEFTTRGHRYQAVRFAHDERVDYYAPDGRSLRKAFLRTPVKFTRISSRFGMRKHPILNRMRAHKGVDYAAPIGTPVRAAGDGKAVFVGWKGGYGRVVILRHGHSYSTVYGHLSRFARGIKPGTRVRQGEVIAYVGRSGLATGPHLHYEFRVNGVHRNPLTVTLPAATPLPTRYKAAFERRSTPLLAMMTEYRRTALALNDARP